ncbi:MAG: hypothetical protein IJU79_06255, partial [Desulfovibrionaceae bacterium]|nr:hypothetical protein [Desulfovibrionaceae bacterium]
NAMQTNLDMSGEDINNVGSIGLVTQSSEPVPCDADNVGRIYVQDEDGKQSMYICKHTKDKYIYEALLDTGSMVIKDIQLLANGSTIDKPTCVNGTPEVWVSPVAVAKQTTETPAITAFQAYARDLSETSWQIILRMQVPGTDQWSFPTNDVGAAQVITLCRPKYAN